MTPDPQVGAYWERAKDALRAARHLLVVSAAGAASRAYYAAFHAVSALFAVQGRAFRKHSALEAAVHRDLVRTGKWVAELGEQYSRLVRLRNVSDYLVLEEVAAEQAEGAVKAAEAILAAVAKTDAHSFPLDSPDQ